MNTYKGGRGGGGVRYCIHWFIFIEISIVYFILFNSTAYCVHKRGMFHIKKISSTGKNYRTIERNMYIYIAESLIELFLQFLVCYFLVLTPSGLQITVFVKQKFVNKPT